MTRTSSGSFHRAAFFFFWRGSWLDGGWAARSSFPRLQPHPDLLGCHGGPVHSSIRVLSPHLTFRPMEPPFFAFLHYRGKGYYLNPHTSRQRMRRLLSPVVGERLFMHGIVGLPYHSWNWKYPSSPCAHVAPGQSNRTSYHQCPGTLRIRCVRASDRDSSAERQYLWHL
jgi:hypothetical protein